MTAFRSFVALPPPPAQYDQRDQRELRTALQRGFDSVAVSTAIPTSAGLVAFLDAHFDGGISIGQLSDPYALASRAYTGGGSLAANDYEVGITAIDREGNESFAQQVTVTGVGASGRIEVDIVPIAGTRAYRQYLRIAAGAWTKIATDTTNTFQGTLTWTALGAASAAPPATNASLGKTNASFTHVTTVAGGPAFFQLNLAAAENSQSAFFFSDYKGICASFQSKGTGGTAPAGGKTELDIAFVGDAAQIYVGNSGTKELDFFVNNTLVQILKAAQISFLKPVVVGSAGTATVSTNYASQLIEWDNSVWEAGAATTHAWKVLANTDNNLEIGYDARVPFLGTSTATLTRWRLRASGSTEVMLEDLTGPVNSKLHGIISDDGVLTFRAYNDNLTTKGDYLSISATGVVSGASFVGSTAAASLTGTTMAANVVTSSLTTIGTLIAGAVPVTLLTGDLPFASFVPATAASRLVGRGSAAGAGDFQELTIGSGLTMTGTVLSAASGSGDVVGPASATDSAIAAFDTTTGKLIKNTSLLVSGTTIPALTGIGTLATGAVPASLVTAGTFGAGAYTFPAALTVTDVLTVGATSASNVVLDVGAVARAIATIAAIRGAAGTERQVGFYSGTSQRWSWGVSATAESGGNAGSNFVLQATSDAGAFIDSPLSVARVAGGAATWTRYNIFPAATTSIPSARFSHGVAPTTPVNGDFWSTTAGFYGRVNGGTVGPFAAASTSGNSLYAPGSFTVATGNFALHVKRLQLTTTQRMTLAGTARFRLSN